MPVMNNVAPLLPESLPLTPARNSPSVLVVEDSFAISIVLSRLLEREGYQVSLATTAPEAKSVVIDQIAKIDLVLLDVNLPGGTGFDILQTIRERSQVPVIMLSALKQNHNVERGLELGAQDFVTKPFNPRELLLRVKQHTKCGTDLA